MNPSHLVSGALVAVVLSGCASGIRLADSVIKAPSGCPRIEVRESGDVELCHHRWAHWTGAALERDGDTLFVMNRGLVTAHGHEVAKMDDDGRITLFVADDEPDQHVRIEPSGKVVDDEGAVVATISPPPEGELPTLVLAAIFREGVVVPALPEKPKRVSATEVQVLGRPREREAPPPLCSCTEAP
ncbi:MAG: hypothetical protein U0414_30550 [Polyangiaceae bacterium]